MGCVHSKRDINDIHSNRFEVTNVDEMGHLVSPGQLELTETELILYQRGKSATHWPLRSLRKYGFDSEIFSFECGRRCPTGAGIYAFRCRKAEQLFNLLQQNIQLRNINDENNPQPVSMYTNSDFPTPVATTGPPVTTRRMSSVQPQAEGYLNPTPAPVTIRSRPTLSRPGSITSNGPVSPVSPSAISPPPNVNCDNFLEHNNNKQQHNNTLVSVRERKHSYTQPSYINLNTTTPPPVTEHYANLCEQPSHLYVNITTNEGSSISSCTDNICNIQTKDLIPNNSCTTATATTDSTEICNSNSLCVQTVSEPLDEPMHCYANIDAAELGNLRASNVITEAIPSSGSAPQTPTYVTVQEVNYAELDLVPSRNDAPSPESPNDKVRKSYVTIDFKKTTALSQSVNPSIEVEEGVRKTRHNSNISDVTTRHSNSLSD
ncbi:uncharacterized protein LOC108734826 [Agrilus planipennis]|uniref:Uncharacterized protein LOC108734826 n=1 Tax=Agrilus planipennis TaxID=224129 RepID=A0A1W4WNI0_AGRPL|nr:uncharacterized protein LOC108734826 [Agrilus planipennis]XP_018322023.1 uncharacterized protein LOC108734826 [Agrilus planipennis]